MALAAALAQVPAQALAVPVRANAPAGSPPADGSPRSPTGPPLVSSTGGGLAGEAQPTPAPPIEESDPLVNNGLSSPFCRGGLGEGELDASDRHHCEISGLAAARAPTGDYGIDVQIDTGFPDLSGATLLSAIQDLLVTPAWMALVWAVHALIVMLEWAFTIDLLDSSIGTLGGGLRQMQASLTVPGLAVVLAIAAVLAAHNGLVRRQVSDTLGHALLAGMMMAGGLWVIADPVGTVGALGAWANRASLGTLALAARGSPAAPGRTLASSMSLAFATAVEGPWCYLEFGDVAWCRDPARLDPRLRAAALGLGAVELAMVGCRPNPAVPCAGPGTRQAEALERQSGLLRGARTNGAVFLALPAGATARNSMNYPGSLLRAICQGGEMSSCHGPGAGPAEFRTASGTWPRVGGLVLIVAGAVGMLLLLGFIGLRLFAAGVVSMLFLLLAPVVVLSPALGEWGRSVFRAWATQLLTAIVSKLLFAFLLGVVLAVDALLSKLTSLGWWTQWLLTSAFWWGAFLRRHQALAMVRGATGVGDRRAGHPGNARRGAPSAITREIRHARRRQPPAELRPGARERRPRATGGRDDSPARRALGALELAQRDAAALRSGSSEEARATLRGQLQAVEAGHATATAGGEMLRARRLERQRMALEVELARREGENRHGGWSPPRREPVDERQDAVSDAVGSDTGGVAERVPAPRVESRAATGDERTAALRRELAQLEPDDVEEGTGATPGDVGRAATLDAEEEESPVMRDAREVEAGRKRYLGYGLP